MDLVARHLPRPDGLGGPARGKPGTAPRRTGRWGRPVNQLRGLELSLQGGLHGAWLTLVETGAVGQPRALAPDGHLHLVEAAGTLQVFRLVSEHVVAPGHLEDLAERRGQVVPVAEEVAAGLRGEEGERVAATRLAAQVLPERAARERVVAAEPRHVNLNEATLIERGTALDNLVPTLARNGHRVRAIAFDSGVNGIRRVNGGYEGGADPRREGVALGD